MKHIMTVHIHCYDSYDVVCGDKTVRQILFDGFIDGPYFEGTICPGGVDTQTIENGKGGLSAKYIVKGKDFEGNDCSLFIHNTAKIGESVTHPTVFSDSQALKFMESLNLEGRMIFEDDFRIEISTSDNF